MKININIGEFIEKKNLKPVTSPRGYNLKTGKIDSTGLFSEEIFGRLGSRERKRTFAYINLNCKIVHPEVYSIVASIDPKISKILSNKGNFKLAEDGTIVEAAIGEDGSGTGVFFFSQIFDKINFQKIKTTHEKERNFVISNKEYILIDKLIVLPAGVRDIRYTGGVKNIIQIQFPEVNDIYDSVINKSESLRYNLDDEIKSAIVQNIQKLVLDLNRIIKDKLRGKYGVIREGVLAKRIDYSARLINTPDPTIKLGYIGIPWQVVIKLFEPFVIYNILKNPSALSLIQMISNSDKVPDSNDLKRFFTKLNEDVSICPPQLRQILVQVANDIVKDKVVLYKRDPVENRDSWLCANVRVDEEGYVLRLNPLEFPRNGADNDGDQFAIYALFTKEAIEEAKRSMHPRYSKSVWFPVTSSNGCAYTITLDAAAAIYMATEK